MCKVKKREKERNEPFKTYLDIFPAALRPYILCCGKGGGFLNFLNCMHVRMMHVLYI